MKSRFLLFSLILALVLPPAVLSRASETWYNDVPENQEYYTAIAAMTEAEVVSGYEDNTFRAMDEVNRVEALKMILEATGHNKDDAGTDTAPFDDMDSNGWYVPYVNYAYQEEILSGDEAGTLRPESSVNRVEALKMLILAADKASELPGVSNDTWYSSYLAYATENALLVPNANGDYTPEAALSRGELCELIYRFQNHPYTGEVEFGDATYYGYSYDGVNTASGTPLEAYGYMAAHKTLPFGTQVRVTNVNNNQSVIVTIVDRGPYGEGRIVDLTPAAFEALGSLSAGVLDVRLEVLADTTTL